MLAMPRVTGEILGGLLYLQMAGGAEDIDIEDGRKAGRVPGGYMEMEGWD